MGEDWILNWKLGLNRLDYTKGDLLIHYYYFIESSKIVQHFNQCCVANLKINFFNNIVTNRETELKEFEEEKKEQKFGKQLLCFCLC